MDYQEHYNHLVERARGRALDGYSERHHVIPRCLGGGNSPSNIVRLTPEEHYVAHQLLVKIYPDDHRLLWAASNMTGASAKQPCRKNKLYGWLRRRLAETVRQRKTGQKLSPEACAAISARQTGTKRGPISETRRQRISAAMKGRAKSAEHRAALSTAKLGKKRGPQTDGHRQKLSDSNKRAWETRSRDFFSSPEYRATQAAKMKQVWAQRKRAE